jgi:hypothetical protein
MSQVRFVPAVSINVVRMAIAAALAVGLFAVGTLSVPATAAAGNNNCSNEGPGGNNHVKCGGVISGNQVNVDVSDIRVLTDNELSVLEVKLDDLYLTLVNVPVNVRVNTIAAAVVVILKELGILVCQVKVGEVGVINNNIAKCS